MSGFRCLSSYPSQDCRSRQSCSYPSSLERFEILVRSILLRQDHPAVVILGHFSPQVQREYGFAGPEHWHDVVAQFYDIPHIRCDSFPPIPVWLCTAGEVGKELITDLLFIQFFFCHVNSIKFTQHKANSIP